MHGDRARLEVYAASLACRLVGDDAVLLDGRIRGRQLFEPPRELVEYGLDIGRAHDAGELGIIGACQHASLRVIGIGGDAENDARVIALVMPGEILGKARRRSHAHKHEAGSRRIERPGMSDAPFARDLPYAIEHIVARSSRRACRGRARRIAR